MVLVMRILCRKSGPKHEDDGKETEEKAQATVDQHSAAWRKRTPASKMQ